MNTKINILHKHYSTSNNVIQIKILIIIKIFLIYLLAIIDIFLNLSTGLAYL
jgi:hypothetical protein